MPLWRTMKNGAYNYNNNVCVQKLWLKYHFHDHCHDLRPVPRLSRGLYGADTMSVTATTKNYCNIYFIFRSWIILYLYPMLRPKSFKAFTSSFLDLWILRKSMVRRFFGMKWKKKWRNGVGNLVKTFSCSSSFDIEFHWQTIMVYLINLAYFFPLLTDLWSEIQQNVIQFLIATHNSNT